MNFCSLKILGPTGFNLFILYYIRTKIKQKEMGNTARVRSLVRLLLGRSLILVIGSIIGEGGTNKIDTIPLPFMGGGGGGPGGPPGGGGGGGGPPGGGGGPGGP